MNSEEEHLREVGRRAVEAIIRAQERTGCKLYDMEILDDDVVIKADYIHPMMEMYADLTAAGMQHEDAVQWCAQVLRNKSKKAEL